MFNAFLSCGLIIDSEFSNIYSWCMYFDVSEWNGPLLWSFVNLSSRFSSEWKILIFNVPSSTCSRMKLWRTSMCFVRWDTDVFSNSNIAQILSTCTLMGYLTKKSINNKIAQTNSIYQHTYVIYEYSDYVKDHVTFSWLHGHHTVTTLPIIKMCHVTLFWVLLSPT